MTQSNRVIPLSGPHVFSNGSKPSNGFAIASHRNGASNLPWKNQGAMGDGLESSTAAVRRLEKDNFQKLAFHLHLRSI